VDDLKGNWITEITFYENGLGGTFDITLKFTASIFTMEYDSEVFKIGTYTFDGKKVVLGGKGLDDEVSGEFDGDADTIVFNDPDLGTLTFTRQQP